MKLRIKGNSIRLRLTQSEVARLAAGDVIREQTSFSPYDVFAVELSGWHLDVISASLNNSVIQVNAPLVLIKTWSASDEEGIGSIQDTGTGQDLTIRIEKDYACLKPRPGEDGPDHFPHPESGISKC